MSTLDKMRSKLQKDGAAAGAAPAGTLSLAQRIARSDALLDKELPNENFPPDARSLERPSQPGATKAQKPKKAPKTDHSARVIASMPSLDAAKIQKIRKRAARRGEIFSKSHVVRAAIVHLEGLDDGKLVEILSQLEEVRSTVETEG